jgi:hypothetical protein
MAINIVVGLIGRENIMERVNISMPMEQCMMVLCTEIKIIPQAILWVDNTMDMESLLVLTKTNMKENSRMTNTMERASAGIFLWSYTNSISYANGDVYEGEFVEGERHGQGTYVYATGNTYRGSFKFGQCHGTGTFTYVTNGETYEGEFGNGEYTM